MGRLVVGVSGSRSCEGARALLVCRVARSAALAGAEVRVGCASGVDAWAGSEALRVAPGRLVVFCAWGPESRSGGAARARAVESVGGSVVWWAGGREGSVSERLRGRTVAFARSGLSCLLAFPGPRSRGTWVAVREAARAGVPVFVWPAGREELPALGRGRWVRVASVGMWSGCWAWRPVLRPSPHEPFADLNHLEPYNPPANDTKKVKGPSPCRMVDRVTGEILNSFSSPVEKTRPKGRPSFWAELCMLLAPIAIAVWLANAVLFYTTSQQSAPQPTPIAEYCFEGWRKEEGWTQFCVEKGEEAACPKGYFCPTLQGGER